MIGVKTPSMSRRTALGHLGMGGLTAVLATRGVRSVGAQEASPAAAGAVPPLLVAWAEAWSSHDPEQVVALYVEDAVYEEVPTAVTASGHDGIRDFVAETHAAFPNIMVTPRNGFQAEGWAVLEGEFAGESAEGQPFTVPFIVVMELDGDKIRRSADYFDLNAILTQLNAATEGTAAATPEA
jgi:steroid delta-isomerase-like uncharacterized protein